MYLCRLSPAVGQSSAERGELFGDRVPYEILPFRIDPLRDRINAPRVLFEPEREQQDGTVILPRAVPVELELRMSLYIAGQSLHDLLVHAGNERRVGYGEQFLKLL